MITIKQISALLDVSPTTVSNVINGRTAKMSSETRLRIEEALCEYHYKIPEKKGQSVSEENLTAVAFCMGEMENVLCDPFCGELLGAIQKELKQLGRYMIYDVPEDENALLKLFAPWNVDGGIILGYDPARCSLLQGKISKPLIFIDSYFGDDEADFDNIGLQDYEGAKELATYLIRLGHESIALFCDQNPPKASNRERIAGFRDALLSHSLTFSEDHIYYLPPDRNVRHETLRQFVKKRSKEYTAAFFASDYMANEAINVFFSKGLRVPEELSVVGFDDNIYARLSRPTLTTVRQSPTEKGREAVKMLLKRICDEEVNLRTMQLSTELIVRESVKSIGHLK